MKFCVETEGVTKKFFNQIEKVVMEEKLLWLRDRSIKRETESLLMTAQEQAIRTKTIKAKIDKTQAKIKCVVKLMRHETQRV